MFSSSCEKFSNTETALIRWNAWKRAQCFVAYDALRLYILDYGAAAGLDTDFLDPTHWVAIKQSTLLARLLPFQT